jgi:hypothetical protein
MAISARKSYGEKPFIVYSTGCIIVNVKQGSGEGPKFINH